ncbi:MAG: hypothetical protein R3B09_00070 [Nannocystaceae bacterium]
MHDGEALVRVLLRGRVLEVGARLYRYEGEGPAAGLAGKCPEVGREEPEAGLPGEEPEGEGPEAGHEGEDPEAPLFLALAEPMPAGTRLELQPVDGGEPWVFEVRRVVEALWQGPGGHRGCHGVRVALDPGALRARDRQVGSEHLADGVAARRLHLCPAPAPAAAEDADAPAGASVIILHSAPDRSPRAAGGGKRRRGRARP